MVVTCPVFLVTCTHTHTHICIHTYIYTHTYTHVCMYVCYTFFLGLCKDILLPHWDAVSPSHQNIINKVLSWPAEHCFPGMCMCVCLHLCVCVCMCVCVCTCVCLCVCTCVCMYIYMCIETTFKGNCIT